MSGFFERIDAWRTIDVLSRFDRSQMNIFQRLRWHLIHNEAIRQAVEHRIKIVEA